MHRTIEASNAGQTRPGTMRTARTSIATESAIFTNPHHSMLIALTIGESDDSRLVAPRAISVPGTTTTAAPYAADHAPIVPAIPAATAAASAPSTTWAAITRHGESTGWSRRKASASLRVRRRKAG